MTEIQPEIIDIGKISDASVISLNKENSTSKWKIKSTDWNKWEEATLNKSDK